MRNLREQVFVWVSELCKEDGKRDFDVMARLISDYEKLDGKGLIGWAQGRVRTIAPTISQAERKLSGVIEAVQFKQRKMKGYARQSDHHRTE